MPRFLAFLIALLLSTSAIAQLRLAGYIPTARSEMFGVNLYPTAHAYPANHKVHRTLTGVMRIGLEQVGGGRCLGGMELRLWQAPQPVDSLLRFLSALESQGYRMTDFSDGLPPNQLTYLLQRRDQSFVVFFSVGNQNVLYTACKVSSAATAAPTLPDRPNAPPLHVQRCWVSPFPGSPPPTCLIAWSL
jgi:hypothetical protein